MGLGLGFQRENAMSKFEEIDRDYERAIELLTAFKLMERTFGKGTPPFFEFQQAMRDVMRVGGPLAQAVGVAIHASHCLGEKRAEFYRRIADELDESGNLPRRP